MKSSQFKHNKGYTTVLCTPNQAHLLAQHCNTAKIWYHKDKVLGVIGSITLRKCLNATKTLYKKIVTS